MRTEPRWLLPDEMRAWRAYVIGSELLRQQLNRELQDKHGLALPDYEVLVRLSECENGQMRMSQLAGQVASSKSRLSHQISRLEKAALVRRVDCAEDARGVVAEITPRGQEALTAAAPTHVEGVRAHLVDLMTPEEQEVIAAVFERVIAHLDTT
ncbi:Transcriptional regulator, MarR family [Actinokineospora spheciospongiae]|uniref:Transcriptional regulator, MarR family n=1 Tax=Actinokineospora spheciospongiae TaxID=909613 RepID=W7IZT9_9PSEU|nr:Transcriptional regulator, MarR family [Actinokineospora spheciospongiae]PWW62129.1 MarR family transcriptional regulator [Actinokineospora spheciospongiae]